MSGNDHGVKNGNGKRDEIEVLSLVKECSGVTCVGSCSSDSCMVMPWVLGECCCSALGVQGNAR